MDVHVFVEYLALFFAGLLAGEEFIVTFGVRSALSTLDDAHDLALRQALIYRLRVIVPSIFLLALVSAGASAISDWSTSGTVARWRRGRPAARLARRDGVRHDPHQLRRAVVGADRAAA